MKHEEAYKKATRTFRDDEEDALLKLAILKERADYRNYFTPELRKAVESAYFKIEEANAKGPGHFVDDEEVHNTHAGFLGNLRHRFGVQQLGIPPYFTSAEWLDVLDPLVDVKTIPARVRRRILPRIFYTRGIRELVPRSALRPDRAMLEIGGETTSSECAPHERLWKIDLRKKPAQLVQEFKAALAAVNARRGMDPAAYKAWKQDRSRKRKEVWNHLEVWKLRVREGKTFREIGEALGIDLVDVRNSFKSASKLIEGRALSLVDIRRDHGEIHKEGLRRTCSTCSVRDTCEEECDDVRHFINQDVKRSTRELMIGEPRQAEVVDRKAHRKAGKS